MSSRYVPAELRRLVVTRANRLCEYCLIHEEDTFFGGEVDHIISETHGGPTSEDNLAYACLFCNRNKGSDIASLGAEGELVRLYNPRTDAWKDHFRLAVDGVTILAVSEIGEVTLRILGFNNDDRLLERQALKTVGEYPREIALRMIESRRPSAGG